jgi:hypothetical protein
MRLACVAQIDVILNMPGRIASATRISCAQPAGEARSCSQLWCNCNISGIHDSIELAFGHIFARWNAPVVTQTAQFRFFGVCEYEYDLADQPAIPPVRRLCGAAFQTSLFVCAYLAFETLIPSEMANIIQLLRSSLCTA